LIENFTEKGVNYFKTTIEKLQQFDNKYFEKIIHVTDDLGSGIMTLNYTFGRNFNASSESSDSSFCKCWRYYFSIRHSIA